MRVYWAIVRVELLASMQYKGWPLTVLQAVFFVVTDPIGVVLMFMRFGSLGAWRMEQVMLCYAMAVFCYGLAGLLLRGFECFAHYILKPGAFDRYLLRPNPLPVQIAGSFFVLHRLPRVLNGLAVMVWAMVRLGISLSLGRLAVLLLAVACGVTMYGATFMLVAGISFWSIKGLEFFDILMHGSHQAVRIPLPYMPKGLKLLFLLVMPLLVVVVYPLSWVCGWGATWWQALLPIPAVAGYGAVCYVVWRLGLARYQGTGS